MRPDSGEHELGTVRPAAVEDGPARSGTPGDTVDGEAGVADFAQLVPGRVEEGLFQRCAAAPTVDHVVGVGWHPSSWSVVWRPLLIN